MVFFKVLGMSSCCACSVLWCCSCNHHVWPWGPSCCHCQCFLCDLAGEHHSQTRRNANPLRVKSSWVPKGKRCRKVLPTGECTELRLPGWQVRESRCLVRQVGNTRAPQVMSGSVSIRRGLQGPFSPGRSMCVMCVCVALS